jgi:hypothetical protein
MTVMIQQLLVLQQQQLAMATNFASATTTANLPKYPSIKFPKWDGKRASVPVFFTQLESYKGDPLFVAVVSWNITTPTTQRESQRIYGDMLASLTQEQLAPFLNNARFANDGIAMMASLVETINPSRPEHRLQDVRDLSSLEQGSQESTSSFMAQVCGFASRLTGVSINDLVPLFTMIGMNHDAYSGLLAIFTGGEPAIVQVNIEGLEKLMLEEDS